MDKIAHIARGKYEETALLSLGQNIALMDKAFNNCPDAFLAIGVIDDQGNPLTCEEAIGLARIKLQNLESKIKIERRRAA